MVPKINYNFLQGYLQVYSLYPQVLKYSGLTIARWANGWEPELRALRQVDCPWGPAPSRVGQPGVSPNNIAHVAPAAFTLAMEGVVAKRKIRRSHIRSGHFCQHPFMIFTNHRSNHRAKWNAFIENKNTFSNRYFSQSHLPWLNAWLPMLCLLMAVPKLRSNLILHFQFERFWKVQCATTHLTCLDHWSYLSIPYRPLGWTKVGKPFRTELIHGEPTWWWNGDLWWLLFPRSSCPQLVSWKAKGSNCSTLESCFKSTVLVKSTNSRTVWLWKANSLRPYRHPTSN